MHLLLVSPVHVFEERRKDAVDEEMSAGIRIAVVRARFRLF